MGHKTFSANAHQVAIQ